MKKKFIAGGMFAIASLLYLTTGSDDYTPEQSVKEAPKGYVYASGSNKLLPVLEVKTADGTKSFFKDMGPKNSKLDDYGFAIDNLINGLKVRETILTGKQTVKFPDKSKSSQTISLTPAGLMSGLDYSGKSNFDRAKFDGVAYGALSKWLKTEKPEEISAIFLGEEFGSYEAFIRSIVDFNRQAIVTRFKLDQLGFRYQSVTEEYLRLKQNFLDKGELPPVDKIEVFEATVMSNVVSITNFSGLLTESQEHKGRAEVIALLLIEYFIYEDAYMLTNLKNQINFTKPQPKDNRLEKRELREQREMSERQRAYEEAQRQRLAEKRLRGRN